jgi:hypothetical protein
MKTVFWPALAAISCVLCFHLGLRASTQHKEAQVTINTPSTLAQVRVGMPKETVLVGLAERYNLRELPGPHEHGREEWIAMGKSNNEAGGLSFSNGSVREVDEYLTESASPEIMSFVRDLFAYLKPEAKLVGDNSVASSARRATALLELEEKDYRKNGEFVEMKSISLRFADKTLEIVISDSSLSSGGPDVKIIRSRVRQ